MITKIKDFIHNTDENLHRSVDGISHMPVWFPVKNQSTAVNIHAYWLVATGPLEDGTTFH